MLFWGHKRTHKKPIGNRFFVRQSALHALRLLSFYLAASFPVYAADQLEIELSMQEAISRSLNKHPELASFTYRMKSAEGDVSYAAVGQKPELSLLVEDAFGSDEYSRLDNSKATLSVSWILDGELSNRRVGKFQAKKTLVDIERDIKRYDIAAKTAHQFLTVIALQDRLAIAIKAQQHMEKALMGITKRVSAGSALVADQLRAEVSVERRKLNVEDITHELKSAKKILASMWGGAYIDFTSVSGSLNISRLPIEFSALNKAIKTNPRIRYFLTQERIIESEITLAKEESKNRLRFNAGVSRYERTEDYGLTFGVSLPLGKSNRNQGRVSALTADKGRYLADANAIEIQLLTQVFVLYEELKHGHHINDSLENKIIPRLARALKETHKAYQLGKYSYQEWSMVQQELLDAQLALIDARLMALNNTVELERLTGLALLRYSTAL